MSETETIDVPTEQFIDFFFALAMEAVGESHFPTVEGVDRREFMDGVRRSNIEDVEIDEGGIILHGGFEVAEVTGRIPASRWNPPETKTCPVPVYFGVYVPWDPFEEAEVHVEIA